ncbi:MAG: hypothetical protein C0459_10435 [Chitinophaga sp.]|jgi:hypothetical protein|nr:hypothetical protein [Chitinophaga sp.]
MIKYVSLSSLISSFLFVAITFTASKFQSFSQNVIGYPFVFFSAEQDKFIGADKQFSLLNFSADFLICIMAGLLIVKVISFGFRPTRILVKR